jgi:hypothetical protein
MPSRKKVEDQEDQLKDDQSYSWVSTNNEDDPALGASGTGANTAKGKKLNVEQEINDHIASLSFDPLRLAEILVQLGQRMLGFDLYEYQVEPAIRVVYSMLVNDGADISMLFSRQSGKSQDTAFCACVIGITFPLLAKIYPKDLGQYANGVKMGLIAPQLEQVDTVYSRCMAMLWSEPCQKFLSLPDINDAPQSKVFFKLKNGSFLKAQSGAKQSKIESKTYHIVWLEEAQDMDDEKVRKSIIPMLAATFGTIVRVGTPNRQKCDFYHIIQKNKKNDVALRTTVEKRSRRRHFEYDYKSVIRYKRKQFDKDGQRFHLLYEKSVQRDKESIGENSEEFRMSYALEWMHELGMFTTEDFLEKNVYDNRASIGKWLKGDFVVAGLDIASARASTVLTLARLDTPAIDFDDRPSKSLIDWVELSNMNYEVQLSIIAEKLIEYDVKILYGDYTGVGRALMDSLIHYLGEYITIIPYTFTVQSKSDMWKRLDEDFSAKRWSVPANKATRVKPEWKNFNDQMAHLQKYWRSSYLVAEKINGWKDDYCDSLGLCTLAGNHIYTPPQEIEVTDNFMLSSSRSAMVRASSW